MAILLCLLLQDPSQADVDKAVARGVEYLKGALQTTSFKYDGQGGHTLEELALAALVYGGATEQDEDVQKLLKTVLDRTPQRTYETVFLCVALDKLDADFYLWKLVECAQFLLDNQCENGQWSYGKPSRPNVKIKQLMQQLRARKKGSKSTKFRIELAPDPHRTPDGDNSNAQIAALGLRICTDAGIQFPRRNVERARDWWLGCQWKDGSWGYAGLDYGTGYMTMAAGGISSLLILQAILGKDAKSDAVARSRERAMAWLAAKFTYHPEEGEVMGAPYSHYSIERIGILGSVEKFGEHAWYAEGARDLLDAQTSDGSWTTNARRASGDDQKLAWNIIDTSLAILFLKRSVRPPVATK